VAAIAEDITGLEMEDCHGVNRKDFMVERGMGRVARGEEGGQHRSGEIESGVFACAAGNKRKLSGFSVFNEKIEVWSERKGIHMRGLVPARKRVGGAEEMKSREGQNQQRHHGMVSRCCCVLDQLSSHHMINWISRIC
jgi:hypothetical protein